MKRFNEFMKAAILISAMLIPTGLLKAQDKDRIMADSKVAKLEFIEADPSMKDLFNSSYAYVIFPNVGKGALIVGGASGNGTVYHKGKTIGTANMVQATVGAQAGGETYREVIFFETKAALDRFKDNKFEFSGEISALAVKSGKSANAQYRDGVEVFTHAKAGLMADVSVGGQKFTYKAL